MAKKNEASSSSSGEKEDPQIERLLSQLQHYSERFADTMGKLISKKNRDEEAEIRMLEPLEQDKEEFKKLLAELNQRLSDPQDREAVIAEIGGIDGIIAAMDVIYSFLGKATEYRGETKAKLARNDREFEWIKGEMFKLRRVAFQVIDKGYNKPRPEKL